MINFVAISWMELVVPFCAAAALAGVLTPVIHKWAIAKKLFDVPDARRVHTSPIPRLGGIAILLAIFLTAIFVFELDPKMIGVGLGVLAIFAMGLIDDIYSLSPVVKLAGQFLAVAITIFFGITIGSLTNPAGGYFILTPAWDVFFTVLWMLAIINTINILDGLDGLAAGVSGIAALTLVALSLTSAVNQPDTAVLAAIVAGSAFGFLLHNWHPAKIFMGDSGSHVLGYMIAALSIINGGKLATAALVLGLPILDVGWAIFRRLRAHRSPFAPDKEHLHQQLLAIGLGQRQVVSVLYLLAFGLGFIALVSGTITKLILAFILIFVMTGIVRLVLFSKDYQIRRIDKRE